MWSTARSSTPRSFPTKSTSRWSRERSASVDDEKKIKKIRAHSKMLVAMGDCAVAGNVPSMRNPIGPEAILDRAYIENAAAAAADSLRRGPQLLKVVRPIHEFVKVDVFLPGCPPSADTFHTALTALLTGEPLDVPARTRRFGASSHEPNHHH